MNRLRPFAPKGFRWSFRKLHQSLSGGEGA
jgi:hypothetical protein